MDYKVKSRIFEASFGLRVEYIEGKGVTQINCAGPLDGNAIEIISLLGKRGGGDITHLHTIRFFKIQIDIPQLKFLLELPCIRRLSIGPVDRNI